MTVQQGALDRAHASPVEEVASALEVDLTGLSSTVATQRLGQFGPNRLERRADIPLWRLVLDEVRNPLVLVLLGAVAVLSALSVIDQQPEHLRDAMLILAIVVLNGVLGFIQNYRAQRGIEALQRMSTPNVRVQRDGRPEIVAADDLVPGDLVLLEEGDRVPADGRVVRTAELRIDEAPLTGESMPVTKGAAPVADETPLAERTSMAYMGTSVASGRGRMLVVRTGMRTELGAIAEAVQALQEEPTPFQRQVGQLGRVITVVVGVLVVVIALLQLTIGGLSPLDTFVTSVALAVAAIPEGLPVVLTLALAFGTRRMLERRSLVRSLPVVEIIGAADIVCTDKTGTVTEGRMSVRRLYWHDQVLEVTGGAAELQGDFMIDGQPTDQRSNLALVAGALCNDAQQAGDGAYRGDPTEVALLVAALKAGVDTDPYERVEEIPFSSERKLMSVVVDDGGDQTVFAKGAPEVILTLCTRVAAADGERRLRDEDRDGILAATEALADEAYRVLALAGRRGHTGSRDEVEQDLTFYGLVGIADPPREAAGPAIDAARAAGIRVVMITGDNPRTAAAVGREIGLQGDVLLGADLDEEGEAAAVERGSIFARVEPTHKLRILNAYRSGDHVVVMTGDGVNDAPALKAADVGIAMGERGTDVARDASDMVLLDDNFATIVAAIEEGRRIAANIKKFLTFLLTGNLAEVVLILVGSLFGYLPITAVQILWVNLVTDSGPALALAVDPAAPGLMREPPRRGPIIGRAMLALAGGVGVVLSLTTLAVFFVGLTLFDLPTAQTMTFTALVAKEYLAVVVIRRFEGASLLTNRWLLLAVAVSLSLQLALLYTPIGGLFGVVPLDLTAWAVIGAALMVAVPVALVVTSLVRRRFGAL